MDDLENHETQNCTHSLRDTNEALERRIADGISRLSEADALLTTARQGERLAAVAFETHNSIVITDGNGTILRVNKSFTELTGYTTEDAVGKTPRILKSGRHGKELLPRDVAGHRY
jgi:PAS domain-containing protein